MQRKVFISRIGFDDAIQKCLMAGFTPAGQARNKRGEFVVFGRR